jgi:hypothetical protein
LAKLIVNVLNLKVLVTGTTGAVMNFGDVKELVTDSEVSAAILVLKKLGIVSGLDDKFYPATSITRGQTAKIIAEAITTTSEPTVAK